MGVAVLLFGAGLGYLIYSHPEGLNPDWPRGVALIAPAGIAMGGLLMIGNAIQCPTLFRWAFLATLACFLGMANWAALFDTRTECVVTISFFGADLANWQPTAEQCQKQLRAIMAGVDLVVLGVFLASVWYRLKKSQPAKK